MNQSIESSQPRIVVVTAGMSLHSSSALLADRLKDATRKHLAAAGVTPRVHTYHLSQFVHEIADHMSMGFPSGELMGLLQALREADAIITVSPTFKASYSGIFKSLWDLTEDGDLDGTPVLLGATGGSPRHSLMIESAMRPLFAYLHADIVATGVFAATDDFGAHSSLEHRFERAGRELAQKILWRLGQNVATGTAPSMVIPSVADTTQADEAHPAEEEDDPFEIAKNADTDLANRDHSTRPPGPPALKLVPFDQLLRDNTRGS